MLYQEKEDNASMEKGFESMGIVEGLSGSRTSHILCCGVTTQQFFFEVLSFLQGPSIGGSVPYKNKGSEFCNV